MGCVSDSDVSSRNSIDVVDPRKAFNKTVIRVEGVVDGLSEPNLLIKEATNVILQAVKLEDAEICENLALLHLVVVSATVGSFLKVKLVQVGLGHGEPLVELTIRLDRLVLGSKGVGISISELIWDASVAGSDILALVADTLLWLQN